MKNIFKNIVLLSASMFTITTFSTEHLKYSFLEINDGMEIVVFKYKDLPKKDLVLEYIHNEMKDNYMSNLLLCHYDTLEKFGEKTESEIYDLFFPRDLQTSHSNRTIENIRLASLEKDTAFNNDDKFMEFISISICQETIKSN